MSLEEFRTLLKYHDWYYMYADDHRAWTEGNESSKKINQILKDFKERGLEEASMELYKEYAPK